MPITAPAARAVAAAIGLALLGAGTPALAQSSDCGAMQKHFGERQSIIQRINGLGKKQVDPRKACSLLNELAANGARTQKFVEANQTWCGIPDGIAENLKADQKRVADLRGKACGAAAKVAQMEKMARQQAQNGGGPGGPGGLLGGPGLTGEYRIPKGAL